MAPERLLKSMLLMALYRMTAAVWDRSTFGHNRQRLLEHRQCDARVLDRPSGGGSAARGRDL